MVWKFIAKRVGISAITKMMEKRAIKKIQNHEKRLKALEKIAHPVRDFVTCDCCKKKLKQK